MKKAILCVFVLALASVALTGCDFIEKVKKNVGQGDEAVPEALDKNVSDTVSFRKMMGIDDSVAEKLQAKENADSLAAPVKSNLKPVYMGMWGRVGGTGFLFDMDGTTGSYIPYDIAEAKEYGARRQLKLVSYNPNDGKCVINAYLQGKYIGQFSGVFFEEEIDKDEDGPFVVQSYNGIFTSVKGAKLEFSFHFD